MSEYKKKIIELIESNLTGYEISKKTGAICTFTIKTGQTRSR